MTFLRSSHQILIMPFKVWNVYHLKEFLRANNGHVFPKSPFFSFLPILVSQTGGLADIVLHTEHPFMCFPVNPELHFYLQNATAHLTSANHNTA
ncbi:hypothetical protein TNCT_731791 [Trichonephila clavata]|uniref:Uncharacterized protein n=1 Tax=Trichonephila clavata TaxID=2740835 RepID=A0A8X6L2I5_TRICU|nr:hypothetical protein TNCT_731791 [Trichonephila clavata]